jgi:hypothetical protein
VRVVDLERKCDVNHTGPTEQGHAEDRRGELEQCRGQLIGPARVAGLNDEVCCAVVDFNCVRFFW